MPAKYVRANGSYIFEVKTFAFLYNWAMTVILCACHVQCGTISVTINYFLYIPWTYSNPKFCVLIDTLLLFPVTVQDLGNGNSFTMAAEVGLLTHNIKIIGEDYSKLFSQSFGARVLIGTAPGDEYDYVGKI